jgi:hypothetical protein
MILILQPSFIIRIHHPLSQSECCTNQIRPNTLKPRNQKFSQNCITCMTILTRSQKLKLKNQETLNTTMSENDYFNPLYQTEEGEDTIEKDIEDDRQDPKFHKFMEKILEKNAQKYFMMLANRGLRLPLDFGVTQLMSKGKETKKPHNDEAETSHTKDEEPPKNKDKAPEISQNNSNNAPSNHLVDNLAQVQVLQCQLQDMQSGTTK